ncbi:MAG: hypothetical protein PHX41_11350 [Kiritimatiellae bacterium]|nr:hypothetical protein [Kiritimatiellia bacterium]
MSMPRLHRHAHSTHRRERRSTSAETVPDRARSDASRRPADRHGSVRHRRDPRVGAANGRTASVLCLMAAFLAFITTTVTELIAHTRQEPTNLLLSLVAGLFALAALATGGYAQTVQLRYWSRRVRNRLLIGLPVGLLTLGTASMNVYRQQVPVEHPDEPVLSAALAPGLAGEDRSLFKPGWYGEGQQDGVLAVVTSYEENAAEARAFNRIVTEPVAYAVLTVINLGSPLPVVLSRTRVTLLLESGEEVQSLEVKPLMRLAALDDRMRQRLAEPRTVVPGAMAADIPVCLDSHFRWQRVRAVKVALQAGDLLVAGRMLTAEEKRALMERSASGKNAVTNLSAETWFKDL